MVARRIGQKSISDRILLTILQYQFWFLGSLVVLLMMVGWKTNEQQLFTAGLTMIWFAVIIFGSINFCNNTSLGRRLIDYSWKLISIFIVFIAFAFLVEVVAPFSNYLWHGELCGLTCVLRGD